MKPKKTLKPKPCPFCGSRKFALAPDSSLGVVGYCGDCGAVGPDPNGPCTRESIIEAWNQRKEEGPKLARRAVRGIHKVASSWIENGEPMTGSAMRVAALIVEEQFNLR